MVKVRRSSFTVDPSAKRFAENVFKVDTDNARIVGHYNSSLKIQMRRARGIIKRPIESTVTIRFKNGWQEEWWMNFENIKEVSLTFHGSIGEAAEQKMVRRLGFGNFEMKISGWGRNFCLENISHFNEHFDMLKRVFLENDITADKYPKGWKNHGKRALPMKVYHKVRAYELTQKIIDICAKTNGIKIGFRFDTDNASLGVQIRSSKTNGVNMETLQVMNEIDTEVRKHRIANDSLHKS